MKLQKSLGIRFRYDLKNSELRRIIPIQKLRMRNIINQDTLQKVLFYFMAFLFFVAILPKAAFRGDMSFWLEWTGWIHEHGLGNIYKHKTEYHPFFLYCLHIFQWIMGTMDEVRAHLNYVKVFPLIFDFVGALSILLILKDRKNALIYPFFLLFNISYMYNTMLWGQVDSIHTAFVVLSLIFVLKKRPLLSIIFFVFALNTKLQAIIYLPIIGLLLLPHFTRSYKFILKSLGVLLATQVIILLPLTFGITFLIRELIWVRSKMLQNLHLEYLTKPGAGDYFSSSVLLPSFLF